MGESDPYERARALALRHLNRRERSEQELTAHLEAKGVKEAVAHAVVAELREQRLVDDARYARVFAQDKRALEGWGRERIARTLAQRGLAREVIDSALAEHGDVQELEAALELLRRRCPEPPAQRAERDRALGILIRKGFESELALEAMRIHRSRVPGAAVQ